MRFREIPGYPALFLDFIEGLQVARQFFPCALEPGSIRSHARSSQERLLPRAELCDLLLKQADRFKSGSLTLGNIQKLRAPDTVCVVATLHPEILGGGLDSWLKILTAARLAAWLTKEGITAVPILWIAAGIKESGLSVRLLTPSGPQQFGLEGVPDLEKGIPARIDHLLEQVTQVMDVSPDESGILQLLKIAYASGTDFALAWGRTVSKLFESLGLILLDPREPGIERLALHLLPPVHAGDIDRLLAEQGRRLAAAGYEESGSGQSMGLAQTPDAAIPNAWKHTPLLQQNLILPAAAIVMEEAETYKFAHDLAIFAALRLESPVLWPRISCTILDARSRKMLARYRLQLAELYSGPEAVTARLIRNLAVCNIADGLGSLQGEIDGRLTELAGLVPEEDRLRSSIENARRRMTYQIQKLKTRYLDATRRRQEGVARQISRLCNLIAPWGRRQEREFSGVQFVLRHSLLLQQILYERLDPWTFEHQLILVE